MEKRVFLNLDTDCSGYSYLNYLEKYNIPVNKETLDPFIDGYKKAGVTDFLINSFCQLAMCESDVFYDSIDKYNEEYENGIKVNYKDWYSGIHYALVDYGINPFEIWFKRCREVGINPWLTMRMNDCHFPDKKVSFVRSDFFYKAKEKGWLIGEDYGYFHYCYNYAVPEVYEIMLKFIKEQLLKYDVYGFEMDFMREIYCFPYREMPECYKIMNNFVRDVKKIIKEAEIKHGHEIKLAARVTRDIEQSKVFGFDVRTWVEEKLIDVLIPSPRFDSSDTDIPIDKWVKEFPKTDIYAGIEDYIVRPDTRCHNTVETVRGIAVKYLSMGAKNIYFYNYWFADLPDKSEEYGKNRTAEVIATCTDLETATKLPYRFIVTYQEDWICPKGFERYNPLPIKLEGGEKKLPVNLAYIPENAEVNLFIGTKNIDIEKLQVTADGEVLGDCVSEFPKPSNDLSKGYLTDGTFLPDGSTPFKYSLKVKGDGKYNLSFTYNENPDAEIDYIEIEVIPKE